MVKECLKGSTTIHSKRGKRLATYCITYHRGFCTGTHFCYCTLKGSPKIHSKTEKRLVIYKGFCTGTYLCYHTFVEGLPQRVDYNEEAGSCTYCTIKAYTPETTANIQLIKQHHCSCTSSALWTTANLHAPQQLTRTIDNQSTSQIDLQESQLDLDQ